MTHKASPIPPAEHPVMKTTGASFGEMMDMSKIEVECLQVEVRKVIVQDLKLVCCLP